MAKQMKQKVKGKKTMKKSFYEVSAPLVSTKIHLYASSKESLDKKTVKIDLTKSLRGKSFELKLRVKLCNNELKGEPESLQLVPSYIRRTMRKSTDYVEDSFETECKDAKIRVKPFLITRKRVSRAVLKTLRQKTKEELTKHLTVRSSKELFSEIITNKLQKQLSLKLKKIYPLALCEIRVFKIIGQK
jgi:ribosomal protein S3AE